MSFSMDRVAELVNQYSLIFWEKQPEVPWDFQAGVFSDIFEVRHGRTSCSFEK